MINSLEIKVFRINPNAKLPVRAYTTDQCFDFFVPNRLPYDGYKIKSGETEIIDLGIKVELPLGYGLEFKERSSLAKRGIIIGGGIIDEGYRNNLMVIMHNISNESIEFNPGDKIAQAELVRRIDANIVEVSEAEFNTNTEREENGFGSSGR